MNSIDMQVARTLVRQDKRLRQTISSNVACCWPRLLVTRAVMRSRQE